MRSANAKFDESMCTFTLMDTARLRPSLLLEAQVLIKATIKIKVLLDKEATVTIFIIRCALSQETGQHTGTSPSLYLRPSRGGFTSCGDSLLSHKRLIAPKWGGPWSPHFPTPKLLLIHFILMLGFCQKMKTDKLRLPPQTCGQTYTNYFLPMNKVYSDSRIKVGIFF